MICFFQNQGPVPKVKLVSVTWSTFAKRKSLSLPAGISIDHLWNLWLLEEGQSYSERKVISGITLMVEESMILRHINLENDLSKHPGALTNRHNTESQDLQPMESPSLHGRRSCPSFLIFSRLQKQGYQFINSFTLPHFFPASSLSLAISATNVLQANFQSMLERIGI